MSLLIGAGESSREDLIEGESQILIELLLLLGGYAASHVRPKIHFHFSMFGRSLDVFYVEKVCLNEA